MSPIRIILFSLSVLLASCASTTGNIAQLRGVKVDIVDELSEESLNKALLSYRNHMDKSPQPGETPDAILNLADLKTQNEFDFSLRKPVLASDEIADLTGSDEAEDDEDDAGAKIAKATRTAKSGKPGAAEVPMSSGAREAIALYKRVLIIFPKFHRNDHALYQLARIYEELGISKEAMQMMDRLAKSYPNSRYIEEVQFRRGEHYYARKKFPVAKKAYQAIVSMGAKSRYYEFAVYKLGWVYYKQESYEEAISQFNALLDLKGVAGYEIGAAPLEKRIDDTYRAISLSFSNMGGVDAVSAYFVKNGKRVYEDSIYKNLGDYYLEMRRYSDAASTFKAFSKRNANNKLSPYFDMWAINSYKKGGFSNLVIASSINFVADYGLKSNFWKKFDVAAYKDVVEYLNNSLKEVASYYHAQYQDTQLAKKRNENFGSAVKWYREFLESFPKDPMAPAIQFQLAELLLDNKNYEEAAIEFEHVAYDYPAHDKSASAGYRAIYAWRKNLDGVRAGQREPAVRKVINISLKFAETFSKNEQASLVMSAAIEDIYDLRDYALAASTSKKLLLRHSLDHEMRRAAWLIFAHSSFELGNFKDAEEGYISAQGLTTGKDAKDANLNENLAASFYKKAEDFNKRGNYKAAAAYFLLVRKYVPTANIRPIADFDGAAALIRLGNLDEAENVLTSLRSEYPNHELKSEVTKKLAFLYKEQGKLSLAGSEYERLGADSNDPAVRREALELAADYYFKAKEPEKVYPIYQLYVNSFQEPLEYVLEMRNNLAKHNKERNDLSGYFDELRNIVEADANGGSGRTDRTRYLAGMAALVLVEQQMQQYVGIKLVKPFDKNLLRKKEAMRAVKERLERLFEYEVGEVTAAATYYLAEMYYEFNQALMMSERPADLNDLEKEQYELSIEEQAYPFEEKAIQVHQKNAELKKSGIKNSWVDKSAEKLARLIPVR